MVKIINILESEYLNEYSVKKYSTPKIFPKDIEDRPLSSFSQKEKKHLTRKGYRWYIYYDYLNPSTNSMERQDPIYYNINRKHKDFDERYKFINLYRNSVENILKNGYSPYRIESINKYSVRESLKFVLNLKKLEVSENTYKDYEDRLNYFLKYLNSKSLDTIDVKQIKKQHINNYLNYILNKTSPSNRNNTRSVLSSLFTKLVKENFIEYNYIKDLDVLKTTPKKNTAFSQKEVKSIFRFLKQNDIWLYYFCLHVYYGLFRNVEVVRISIGDIDLKEKQIKSKTKTGIFYKQLPNVLIEEFYSKIDLSIYPKNYFLFTKDNKPSLFLTPLNKKTGKKTTTAETNRRSYWGKRFTKIARNPLGFTNDYTIYSLRHSAIGVYFINNVEKFRSSGVPNFVEKALDAVREITLHENNKTVKNYLREIGYYKVDDWSDMM